MIAVRLAVSELRRLAAGVLPKLALVALIVIPSLYSGLYLFANEDPYGHLDKVPAAIVVADRGATTTDANGQTERVDYGQDVARRLLGGDAGFSWVRTTQKDAEAGVRSGRFDAALLIGPSFSSDLVSSAVFKPQQASLTLVTNDANNYLATTIADTIVGDVRDAIASEVGTEAADRFLRGLGSIHTELTTAVKGASELVDGTQRLVSGTGELLDGTGRLASGARQAADGASQLASGAAALPSATSRLSSGASTLADGLATLRSKTSQLPDQTSRLASGAQEVASGVDEVATVARDAQAVVTQVQRDAQAREAALEEALSELVQQGRLSQAEADQLRTIATDVSGVVDQLDNQLGDAVGRVDELSTGADEVAAGASQLAQAAPQLTQGIASAASGGQQLAAGAAKLNSSAATLVQDLQALQRGTAEVSSGADQLASGSGSLDDGARQLDSGVTELRDRLADGLGAIPDPDEKTERETARTIGNPVTVAQNELARAGSYGAGLAPFFMSLATWIGGYVLFLLVVPLSRRALAATAPSWQAAVGGWLPAAVLGAAQVGLMYVLVSYALHIRPVHAGATIGLLLLASATFIAIIQALNVWFGAVGEFLGLVLMLVQLVTAGGTFPWQTIPEPLLSLHRILPMSYTVEGLRQTLYGGDLSTAARYAGILLAGFVLAMAATVWAAHRQRVWTPTSLQPELVL